MTLDTQEVVSMYESGMSGTKVAEELGVTSAAVYYHLRKAGVDTSRGVDADRAAELYESGMTTPEVADELGVAISTIHYHLKKQGVEMRSRGARRMDLPVDEIIERWQSGESLTSISDDLGVSRSAIKLRVQENGFETGPDHGPDHELEEYIDEIRRLHDLLGREPTIIEFNAGSDLCPHTVMRHESMSWNELKEEAGVVD